MKSFIKSFPPDTDQKKVYLACIVLVIVIIGAYWPVWTYEFTNWDDPTYITDNRHIKKGITSENLSWAFLRTRQEGAYWHPLTWISHMLDCQLFGLNAGRHHLTSLFLHIVNSLLLLAVAQKMSGSLRVGLLTAFLFALHPVNVDSVAWISERKSLLSAFFWLASMLAYIRYAKRPSFLAYGFTLLLFVAGLMSKPVLITLPFVFLLMDYWPTGRFNRAGVAGITYADTRPTTVTRLIVEKIPFFVLSFLTIAFARASLEHQDFIVSEATVPMLLRIENALVSYIAYICKMVWPANLATYYPFPDDIPSWKVVGSVTILITLTGVALRFLGKRPWLCFGWFWFLGTLVPMSGLMQGGLWPAMADRWAYIPFIGLFLAIAMGTTERLSSLKPGKRIFATPIIIGVLAALAVSTYFQQKTWANSVTLFRQALKVTGSNWQAHTNLGAGLLDDNKPIEAAAHLKKAIKLNPHKHYAFALLAAIENKRGNPDAAIAYISKAMHLKPDVYRHYLQLGLAQVKKGETDAAAKTFQQAISLDPENAEAYASLGFMFTQIGDYAESIPYLEKALALDSEDPETYVNIAGAYFKTGASEKAIRSYQNALTLDPNLAAAYLNLGVAYAMLAKYKAAVDSFEKAIAIDPENQEAQQFLAHLNTEMKRWDHEIERLKTQLEKSPEDPNLHFRLGSVFKESGRIDSAIGAYRKTIALDPGFLSAYQGLAMARSQKKEYDQALETLFRLDKLSPKNALVMYNIAVMYALKNETDRSLEWLQKALENGYTDLEMIRTNPDLENVRRAPGFKALASKFFPA